MCYAPAGWKVAGDKTPWPEHDHRRGHDFPTLPPPRRTAPNCTREKAIARNKKVQASPTAIWKRRRFMPASRKLNFTTALGVSRQVNADQGVFRHWRWPIPRCRRQGHPRSSLDAVQLADSNILAVI